MIKTELMTKTDLCTASELVSMGLLWKDGKTLLLDQTKLPEQEIWFDASETKVMEEALKMLRVRGAPLIGVAAALCIASRALAGESPDHILKAIQTLRDARPTAVNLMWAMDRMKKIAQEAASQIVSEAIAIFKEDVLLCERIGANGANLINDGDHILTHCNAGALATAGIGTAVGVIAAAHFQGKKIHVFVDETRPLLQGARLTCYELAKLGIPHTLICDNMAAALMKQKRIHKIVVGADRIARNGDFANKIGTYSVAVNAYHHQIPFYVAAPHSTVDFDCPSGASIPIEERAASEVWNRSAISVSNPAFDVTPADLVTALIWDLGVVSRADLLAGKLLSKDALVR